MFHFLHQIVSNCVCLLFAVEQVSVQQGFTAFVSENNFHFGFKKVICCFVVHLETTSRDYSCALHLKHAVVKLLWIFQIKSNFYTNFSRAVEWIVVLFAQKIQETESHIIIEIFSWSHNLCKLHFQMKKVLHLTEFVLLLCLRFL